MKSGGLVDVKTEIGVPHANLVEREDGERTGISAGPDVCGRRLVVVVRSHERFVSFHDGRGRLLTVPIVRWSDVGRVALLPDSRVGCTKPDLQTAPQTARGRWRITVRGGEEVMV